MTKLATEPTFAILEGIGEGRLISRKFRQQVQALGWTEGAAARADVIITHSGGIYILPNQLQARLFIHLNCTQAMSIRQLIAAHRRKIRSDLAKRREKQQMLQGLLALGLNGLYLLNIKRGLAMKSGFMQSDKYLESLPSGRHVFIYGINDGLSDAEYILRHAGNQHTYMSIRADHDDCWSEPERYVATLQRLVR